MKARQLIREAVSGPALKLITRAFDDAWSDMAGQYDKDGPATDAARLRLARVILAIAGPDGNMSPQQLKDAALEAIAMNDRAVSSAP